MSKTTKRLLIISDLHCGHRVGLTPKEHNDRPQMPDGFDCEAARQHFEARERLWKARDAAWDWYTRTLDANGPYNLVVHNGDAVDGKGILSGGTEQLTTDRDMQATWAAACIKASKAPKVYLTYGTGYHTGRSEDWESTVAHKVNAEALQGHLFLDVHGCKFSFKHKTGASQVPHGRHTAVARDRLWNQLWAERGVDPKADVIVRSHVHYHSFAGGPGWLAMTTPALQGLGSKYGTRECSGLVDFGFIVVDVKPSGDYSWRAHLHTLDETRSQVFRA